MRQPDDILRDLNEAVSMVNSLNHVSFDDRLGLDPDAYTWIERKCRVNGVHEPATMAAFLVGKDLTPFNEVFDCGALYGYFSLWARELKPDVRITAFDVHPAAIKALRDNLPDATIAHVALSDISGPDRQIWISGFNLFEEPDAGWEDLVNDSAAMKPRGKNNRGRGFIYVPLLSLDDHCEATGAKPDFIKIDVEAYQAKAVRGAIKTIEKYRPMIVIELHDPEKIARMGTTNKDTVQPLFDMGYSGYWCGNFRDADASFERVGEMTDRHEKLSIMVFAVA